MSKFEQGKAAITPVIGMQGTVAYMTKEGFPILQPETDTKPAKLPIWQRLARAVPISAGIAIRLVRRWN